MLRRIHRILLLLALLIGSAGMNYVQAATYSGNCGASGNNVKWSLDTETGVMTLSGSGAMADWDNTTTPWNSYLSSIQTVKVGSGITRIGSQAFYNCNNLSSVTFSGTTLTSIGQFAFRPCSSLTSITFPSSLTSIEWGAFQRSGLMIVDLPSSFTSLGSGAFFGSTNLKYVIIPSSVTTIKNQAFENCSSLEEIHVKWTTSSAIPAWPSYFTNKTPSSIKLYVPCGKSSLYRAKDGWKNYTIVEETASGVCGSHLIWSLSCDGVLTISGTGAMADWASETNVPWRSYRSSITSVSIANGVTSIGSYAFYGCSNLTSCQIPSSITQIGSNAFRGCSTLTAITIPNSVTSLGAYAFYGCSKLKEVTLSENLTEIKSCTFQNCSSLVSITIPNGVINVGWASFYGCAALTNIYVSWTENIPSWGPPTNKSPQSSITLHVPCGTKSLYQAANGWKNYTLTETTIGGNCGASGNNLTWSFCIGTGTLTISGSGAMKDWSAETDVPWYIYAPDITSVVLPVGLTHIGANAFYGCAMTKIDIPAAVRTFGTRAFQKTSLRELYIPEGVTAIPEEFVGANLRSNAAPLERIYLPSTLTTLGGYSLSFTRLRTLTIPKSVTNSSIGIPWNYAYTPFTNIYASWTENVPQRGGRTEARNPNASKMHVPYGTKSLYTGFSAAAWSYVCGIVEDVDERAIDLGLSIRWASCNIGATAPEENGDFYAWGDTLTRSTYNRDNYPYSGSSVNTLTKYCTRAGNGTVDNRSTLLAFDDAAYINWGETWRMPTWAEWNELITQCIWKDTTYNDVHVWQVTGPNGNSIYLPVVGYMNTSTLMPGCYYWSSSLNTADSNDGCNRALYIDAADRSGAKYCLRQFGMPVRAVYRREWPSFTLTITDTPDGTTYTKAVNAGSTYTLTAQEDACRPFVRWSDGNTENPRTVTVTEDATYTAVYDRSNYHSGTCGAQGNNVRWALCDGVLTITGTGEMANWSITTTPWKNYKTDITTVSIEDGVTSIGTCAFYGCSNLTSVTIGTSVTTLNGSVFAGCTSLTSITFPNSVTSIGQSVCEGCIKLTSVVLPDGLKNISSYAFKDCFSLPSITIPDGVEFIRESAFNYCKALQSVTIPSSVIYIYAEAFRYCSALKDIYVSWTENIPYWPPDMTSNSDITLHVPCEAIELYNAAYGWKDYTIEGEGGPYTVTVTTNDASMGMVQLGTAAEQASFTEQFNCGEEITITAIPANGYAFDQWSDNSYQASRTIMLTSDTTLTALFKQSVYPVEHGALPGVFSVSDTKKVVFSQGNLQFNAALGTHQRTNGTTANGTWRFAENQYDFVGDNTQGNVYYNDEKCSNERVSNSYNGWIDYFNHGNTGYSDKSPTSYTTAFGMNFNSPSVYDWGSYVAISNGGNMPGYYIVNGWIVLQRFQWNYLFNSRANAQDLRSLATVNDVLGCILLPDDWQLPSGIVFTPDESSYATNTYTREQWNRMEQAGAVFLPAAGRRDYDSNGSPQLSYPDIQTAGYVWSSSGIGNQGVAVAMSFGIDNFALKTFIQGRGDHDGLSVRLAHYVSSYHVIFRGYKDGEENVVLQDKLVAEGAMPIPPEVPEDDCRTFIGWDRVIEPASGDTEYIAQYELKGPYTVTVTTNDASMGDVSIIVN